MANIPTPRSFTQIVGDMVDAFLSRVGIPSLKVGGPPLALIEAVAQSQLRTSQDIFSMQNAISLDRAEGIALERIGADEDLIKITESEASGLVTIGDSRYTKLASKIYQGQAAPIIGSDRLYVANATDFPASGQVYVGRGTTSYEGPLTYTAKTNLGTYWRLDLDPSSKTQKFHNHAETVIVAQGGSRVINAGTMVQTQQGGVSESVKFKTLYLATMPDGEVELEGVLVIAEKPGITGNVTAGAINSFTSEPFTGATVTNPLPFTNAQPTEDDKTFRERIRAARQSRAKGTALAIKTAVLGITADDENKRVVSASVVSREGFPTTLYIDDGTGYEERSQGVALETLTDFALGGEQYFQVSAGRPVTKAYVATTLSAPFSLKSGMVLAVKVGGILSKHTFNADEFKSITSAGADEVVASINGNPEITFSARTVENSTQVAVFAREDQNEDVESVEADDDEVDANPFLGFSAGRVDTARLYLNDRLLSKDGQVAVVESEPQSDWAPMTSPMTLTVEVDGTAAVTYSFTDADFVAAGTGYTTLASSNSVSAWAAVFNAKVPGLSATVTGSKLTLTSNLDASARAKIRITGGTLLSSAQMFVFNTADGLESEGKSRDYTLDRNTGQLRLESSLVVGDRLDLGSVNTRAFIESDEIAATTLASDAELWFVVDGSAQIVATGVVGSTAINIAEYVANPDVSWGNRVRITATAGAPFSGVAEGDWAIFLDTNLVSNNRGAWRVAYVDAGDTYFEVEKFAISVQSGVVLSGGGITFVRSTEPLQKVTVAAAANYTAATFADAINATLFGATAETYRTNRLRVRTNSYAVGGDIALVAQNSEAHKLLLDAGEAVENNSSHLASVQASNQEAGTPSFAPTTVSSITSSTVFGVASAATIFSDSILKFLRALPDSDSSVARSRYGTNVDHRTAVTSVSGTTITARRATLVEWLAGDRLYAAAPYALGPSDDFTVVVDDDTDSRRYAFNTFRKVKPTSATYGITNSFSDSDNSNLSLAVGFGLSFSWKDFAAYMKARVKSHSGPDTTKTILWRYHRFGPDGNQARLRYTYPTAPDQALAVSIETSIAASEGQHRVNVRIPSGSVRSGWTLRSTQKVGVMSATTGSLQTLTYIVGYAISSAIRNVKLNYTARNATAFTGTVTGGTSGATGTVVTDSLAGGSTGAGTLTLSSVTGTFTNGETITAGAASATVSGTQVAETTLTLNIAAPSASDHGFAVSDQLWVQSSDGNFSTGAKTITAKTASTVTYTEGTNSVASTPNIGTVSFDPGGECKFTGSNIASNDIMTWGSATSLPAGYEQTTRITEIGAQFLRGLAETANSTGTVPAWSLLTDSTAFKAYPLTSVTAASVTSSVNALAAVANSTCPVTAVAIGSGGVTTGVIDRASFDESGTPGFTYSLTDGINWVSSNTSPADTTIHYSFTFKNSVTAALATNSDWDNEEIRLVPITAKGISDFFNVPAVSGLSSSAEVSVAGGYAKLEISSLTAGSSGSVEVQGGAANAASASVIGSASISSTYMLAQAKKANTEPMVANAWVEIVNSNVMPKDAFSTLTSCTSIDALGNFVISGTQAWTYANSGAAQINGFPWIIEKHGNFTCFRWTGIGSTPALAGISEGDWVVISKNATTISSRNTGQFRVVRCNDTVKAFWIENSNSAHEVITADLWFLTYDSLMPGDALHISTTLWGANNVGVWTVKALDSTSAFKFSVDVASKATAAFTGPQALGAESSLVQCFEGSATKLVKQIQSVILDSTDGTLVSLKFKTEKGYKKVGAVAGSLVRSLDKLAFTTNLSAGIDGYGHSIGLIGEAAKVLYGDERDPATYPGVVAAGARVNISGPLVKRIQVALAIRVRSGASTADVLERVRSSVAAVVNRAGLGQAIAISDLVTAAASINGVISVTILSPTYSAGNDLIPVQPYEKPMVLNLDQDVNVSLTGE